MATLSRWLPAALLFVWLSIEGFVSHISPDEAAYKIVDVGIVHGRWPYHDLFINRQPLTFLWYLPMGFGASVRFERVLAAAAMAASVAVVARMAGQWLAPGRARGASIIYAILLANPLMPVRANTEAFVLLPLTASFVVGSPFVAGALLGVAVMTKLHAALFAPVLVVLWWRRLPALVAGGTLVLAVCSLAFVPVWHDFWAANVTFAIDYGRFTTQSRLHNLVSVDWVLVYGTFPLWIAGLFGLVRNRRLPLLVCAICGVASVKASGFDYDHYYALLLPPVALLAADGLEFMRSRRALRLVLASALTWAVIMSGAAVIALFSLGGAQPVEVLADAAAANPGEMFVLGSRQDIYLYADRQPQRRFFFSIPYVMAPRWGESVRADLLRCPPDVLVVPSEANWPIPWRAEVTASYAQVETLEAGAIYTAPSHRCDSRE